MEAGVGAKSSNLKATSTGPWLERRQCKMWWFSAARVRPDDDRGSRSLVARSCGQGRRYPQGEGFRKRDAVVYSLHLRFDREAQGRAPYLRRLSVGHGDYFALRFDLKESDVYWCTADIGWITGHSYV